MIKVKYKISFKDHRGIIIDMIEKERINAVTLITSEKKSVRGNHYHKKTWQWNYILDGKAKLVLELGLTGIQVGPNATATGLLGIAQA